MLIKVKKISQFLIRKKYLNRMIKEVNQGVKKPKPAEWADLGEKRF